MPANSTLVASSKIFQQKDVTEAFKNLPEDDLEFIKELDKQFKLHGGKLKIEVQHDNITHSKNSKRTIEGDLGYGYAHNGYHYERPKFMFYPYSQKDIPSDAPAYFPQYESTSVTIEPSYSYELKPQTYVVTHDEHVPQIDLPRISHAEQVQQDHEPEHDSHQENYQEPVIVLRIPGPAKYATHLQSLLQQYLEIRAAQYLRILEETESRKQQEQVQQYDGQYQAQDYEEKHPSEHVEPPATDYHAEIDYSNQFIPVQAHTSQPIMYPAIHEVYHNYKDHYQNHQHHHQHEQQHQHHHQHQHEQQHQQEQNYKDHQQQHHQQQAQQEHNYQHHHQQQQHPHQQEHSAQVVQHHQSHLDQTDVAPQYYYQPEQEPHHQQAPHEYQQVYLIAMGPDPYSNEEQQYSVAQQQQQQQIYVKEGSDHQPSTSENNPRSTHTKIVFTQNAGASAKDQSNMYPLPSIRPFDRHAPTSQPHYHQVYQPQRKVDLDYQQSAPVQSSHQKTVAITQRPFNYDAHQSKTRSKSGRKRYAPATVASTTPSVHVHVHMDEKLVAQTGSAMENKSPKTVNG